MSEKVSIIVPIYNVERYLKRCIDSLLNQVYQNIEILLIDDCSLDNSAIIAREYVEKHSDKCKYIKLKKNMGVSGARNFGINISHGVWLTFIDSDDWVDPEYISSMYIVAQRDNADIVMSGCTYIWENGKKTEMFMPEILNTSVLHRDKVALCRCSVTAKLIRKSLLDQTRIHFSENIRRLEELSTMVPLFTYTERISIVPKSYYFYYQRENSSSNQNNKDTNLDFFTQSVERMFSLSKPGFCEALEYRVICELMYSMIMTMIRCRKPRRYIVKEMRKLNQKYSGWVKNPYLCYLPKLKRVFLRCVEREWYFILKLMVIVRDVGQGM